MSDLLEIVRRFHPTGALDVDEGYEDLPEVRARRTIQRAAPGAEAWNKLLGALRALWPDAMCIDHSTLHLDCGRQVRVIRDASAPDRHLVAWTSLLAPVALVYGSLQPRGELATITTPERASDGEGMRQLVRMVEAGGWSVLPWDTAVGHVVPGVSVGNLLPGEATLASCLFSDSLR